MKKLLCRIFGHKWRDQFVFADSLDTSRFCIRCGRGAQLYRLKRPGAGATPATEKQ
jgi:hypothetical protein